MPNFSGPRRKGGSENKRFSQKKGDTSKGPKQRTKLVSRKNQIRAVERLLKKGDLDTKVRKAEEAKLESLKEAQLKHEQAQKEQRLATRYHRVRFFERVKIERGIKKLQHEVKHADSGKASHDTARKLAQLQEDLKYVLHFPKGEKYVSLLKQAEDPEAQAALEAERQRLRVLVQKRMAEDALLNEADEGRPQQAKAVEEPQDSESAPSTKKQRQDPTAGHAHDSKPLIKRAKVEEQLPPPARELDLAAGDDFFIAADDEGSTSSGNAAQGDVSGHLPLPTMPEEAPNASRRQQGMTGQSTVGSETRPAVGFREKGKVLHSKRHANIAQKQKPLPTPARHKPATSGRPAADTKLPLRTRAEGGRKRRK